DAEMWACARVGWVVASSHASGTKRREYSWASKCLHWLTPWRVPIYDSFVRRKIGVPTTWDHPLAYCEIVSGVFEAVRSTDDLNGAWLGTIEPRSPLRGFDKSLWWIAGGAEQRSVAVQDPWKVHRELGLRRLA